MKKILIVDVPEDYDESEYLEVTRKSIVSHTYFGKCMFTELTPPTDYITYTEFIEKYADGTHEEVAEWAHDLEMLIKNKISKAIAEKMSQIEGLKIINEQGGFDEGFNVAVKRVRQILQEGGEG